jgi:hypothetical protein
MKSRRITTGTLAGVSGVYPYGDKRGDARAFTA